MDRRDRPWVIVLAGGRGARLRALTTASDGGVVPKQFCRFGGGPTMLGITLARARRLTPGVRILIVALEGHRGWWKDEVTGLPAANLIVQADDRGTAIALLRVLIHVGRRDPGGRVVVLPSDHQVDSESILSATIVEALEEVRRSPRHVVLIGAPSTTPDPSLGWIVPGRAERGRVRGVVEFVEKPDLARARACVRRGAMRNTLILAGEVGALTRLYGHALPRLFGLSRPVFVTAGSASGLLALVESAPAVDLGRDILGRSARRLRVIPLPECGWADIGTVRRLEDWWRSHPAAWMEAWRNGFLPPDAREPSGPGHGVAQRRSEYASGVATGTDGSPGDPAA